MNGSMRIDRAARHPAVPRHAGSSRRRFLRATAVVMSAGGGAVLAACGAVSQPAAESTFRGSGPTVTITYLQRPKPPDRQAVLDTLLAEFFSEVPRIKVEVAVSSELHVVQKALQLHLAGSTAEIVEWARDGHDLQEAITDLNPLMRRDRLSPSLFVGTAAEIMSYDGKFAGIPASIASDALLYNPNALQEVGLRPPPVNPNDRSWTTEQFQEYAIKLTQRPDRFGWSGKLSSGFQWMDAATYFGVGVWDDKTERLLVNTPEFRRGLQYWVDLRLRHRVVPDADESKQIGGVDSGKIAMDVPGQVPTKLQFTPGTATLPYSGPGRNVSARISPGSVFAGPTKQLDAAWELLKWLLEPRRNARHVRAFGHAVAGVSKAQELRRQDVLAETGIDPQAWILQAGHSRFVGWGLYKYPQTEIAARNEIQPRYGDELLTGKISVNEFCAFAEQQLKQAIAAGR